MDVWRRDGDDGDNRSLFIFSETERDALADLAQQAGWKATSVRRRDSAERRYLASDATIALIDVRRGNEEVLEGMASAVEASGGALIVLIDARDLSRAPGFITGGATHYLCAPVNREALEACLASANALVRRQDGRSSAEAMPHREERNPQCEGNRDYLTGLANRQAAVSWLEKHLDGSTAGPIVLLLSIGPLDRINAAYGQVAGDVLLGRIARRVERLAGEFGGAGVLAARIAGTQYLIGIASGILDTDRSVLLARRIVAAIAQPFSAGDHLIRLTGRCGIAEALPGDTAVQLLRRAGTALADAKHSDGEGIRLLTASTHSPEADPDRLESDLRLALDRGEIDILFQPQYSCADDRLTGAEALARWNHPHYGPLGASALFSAAERSDFLLPLSAHIQAEALRQAANWADSLAALRLSINVTASDISQPQFLDQFLAMVDASGFPRSRLTVEITESGMIEDVDAAATLLSQLRSSGLAVAIDDFGTGYSSLAYLKALPLDYLKIDSGLAQDIAGSERDRIIVRGVIQMAKALGMKVVAEGVETHAQRELLTEEGCDFFQGFLKSHAVSGAELAALANGEC